MKYFLVVNVDWFFLSHRLLLALEAQKRGYDVTIFAIEEGGHGEEIRNYGFEFVPLPTSRSGSNVFRELTVLLLLIRKYLLDKPDIIHHVAIKPVTYGSIAAKITGSKNVVNAFAGLGFLFINSDKNKILSLLVRLLFQFFFNNKYLKFIVQNPDDHRMLETLKGADPSQIFTIKGSGVDLVNFGYCPPPSSKTVRIVLVARMLYDKGVEEFVQASKIVADKFGSKVHFQLVGGVDLGNKAFISEEILKDWNQMEHLYWLGHQTDIFQIYKEASIVVLPSYREGLPKSLIEACAIGRPIVTTDVPGCREVVTDGVNGFLVPPKNSVELARAISKLIENEELRLEMGLAGRKRAEEEFGIENVVKRTFEIYDMHS